RSNDRTGGPFVRPKGTSAQPEGTSGPPEGTSAQPEGLSLDPKGLLLDLSSLLPAGERRAPVRGPTGRLWTAAPCPRNPGRSLEAHEQRVEVDAQRRRTAIGVAAVLRGDALAGNPPTRFGVGGGIHQRPENRAAVDERA